MRTLERGYTLAEVAGRLRTSKKKVTEAIRRGLLVAIDLGNLGIGRRQKRVMPEALLAFEKLAEVRPATKAKRRRPEAFDHEVEKFLE